MAWWEISLQIIPWVVTASISIVALRNTSKLKELELKDNERARRFELQKQVTFQAIESMKEGCFRLGKQVIRFGRFVSESHVDVNTELLQQMQDDHDFIEMNKAFFPRQLRNKMCMASSQLSNIIRNYNGIDSNRKLEIFSKALPIVKKAKIAMDEFIDEYNLFNEE